MADKESLIQYVAQQVGPEQLQQMVDMVEQELANDPDITPESIDGVLEQLEFLAENPDAYQQVVQSLINEGVLDAEDFPPQFDPFFIAVIILALQELNQRGSQGFAKGGLAQAAQRVAAAGRNGDSMLAHINPREAAMLKRMGGSGRINPQTGLLEFGLFKSIKKAFKKVVKAVSKVAKFALPAIANYFVPGSGMVVGGLMGAMNGGGLKGALMGGLSGAMLPGNPLSDTAKSLGTNILGTGVGSMLSNVVSPETLGAGVIGAGAGALTGGVKGALAGGVSAGALSSTAGGINNAMGVYNAGGSLTDAAKALFSGNALQSTTPTAGVQLPAVTVDKPLPGFGIAPETISGPGVRLTDAASIGGFAPTTSLPALGAKEAVAAAAGAPAAGGITDIFKPTSSNLLRAGLMLGSLGGQTPQTAYDTIQNSALTEQQKQDMARALTNYTASWNANTLPAEGTPEYADMMNKISQGIGIDFMNPTVTTEPQPQMARGGALSKIAMLAAGSGHGRSDTIDAKLSDGEYVIDAETVALLGNGSTKAGAAALDQMRKQIRQQKGKVLAKGKFSPNAKSPLAYMKGGL